MPARSAERQEFLADIITTAVEGGINYWSKVSDYCWQSPSLGFSHPQRFTEGAVPDKADARVTVWDYECDEAADDKPARFDITVESIASALAVFRDGPVKGLHESNRRIVVEADRENEGGMIDADAADWIIQVACHGEVIYG